MKALVVTQLIFNEQANCYEEGRDYTFINPSHVSIVESLPLDVLTFDEDLGTMIPRHVFAYKVTLAGTKLFCTVEDKEFFYSRLVGDV
ncbi:MAG: hypothetical protein VYC14_08715 [Actinomycetota bacterium]|nr:hypothetical protein [Actinomycetota bacterium]